MSTATVPSVNPQQRPQLVINLDKVADYKTMNGEFKKLNGVTSQATYSLNKPYIVAAFGLGILAADAFIKRNPLLSAGLTILTLAAGFAGVEVKQIPTQAYQKLANLFDECTEGLHYLWKMKSNTLCAQFSQCDKKEAKSIANFSKDYDTAKLIAQDNSSNAGEICARYVHAAALDLIQKIATKNVSAVGEALHPAYQSLLRNVQQEALRVIYGKPVAIEGEAGVSMKEPKDEDAYVQLCKLSDGAIFALPWPTED